MNKLFKAVLSVAVVLAIGGSYLYPQVQVPLGANPGPDFLDAVNFLGGVTYGNVNATNTNATAIALQARDIVGYDTIVVSPVAGSVAFTFPASSTLASLVPRVGQRVVQCWENATTTASIDVTFVAGVGVTLLAATSTAGGIGIPTIAPSDIGCFIYSRATSSASAFDIRAAFIGFKDAD